MTLEEIEGFRAAQLASFSGAMHESINGICDLAVSALTNIPLLESSMTYQQEMASRWENEARETLKTVVALREENERFKKACEIAYAAFYGHMDDDDAIQVVYHALHPEDIKAEMEKT